MNQTITMPLWLLILILAFALVTFSSHFFLPSIRWYFRRRMERVVARLNTRLQRPIEPFKLLRRHDMIMRLSYDPQIIEAVAEHAAETGLREDVAFQEAQRYAREIVPSFSASAYFGFAIWFARLISRAFYRVRVGEFDRAALDAIDPHATVIFIMNHRSNMDYVLVTYLAARRGALSYAVGEWARVWPLSRLIKAMGAYFIRRKSRNALYRRVLARYVQMATAAGVAQAVYPEGGLSLNGRVGEAKLGLLNYIVSDFSPDGGRDVVFVPVALNYDRVLEDRVLLAAATSGQRKFRFSWRPALGYFVRHIWQRLTGRFIRYGYAAVSFGTPISLAEFSKGKKGDVTKALGREVMKRIRAIVPALPVPLVASCIVAAGGTVTRDGLEKTVAERIGTMRARGVHVGVISADVSEEVTVAVNHLLMRRVISEGADGIHANPDDWSLLEYYAASIAQHS